MKITQFRKVGEYNIYFLFNIFLIMNVPLICIISIASRIKIITMGDSHILSVTLIIVSDHECGLILIKKHRMRRYSFIIVFPTHSHLYYKTLLHTVMLWPISLAVDVKKMKSSKHPNIKQIRHINSLSDCSIKCILIRHQSFIINTINS